MLNQYTRIIVHQFDPEFAVPGGVDTCLRDMLMHTPRAERILVIGVSQSRPLMKKVTLTGFNSAVDFIPVSRADPGNQARLIPHSIRVALGAFPQLLRADTKDAVLQYHRIEIGLLAGLIQARRHIYFIHTNTALSLQPNSDSFWRRIPHVYKYIEGLVLKRADLTIVFNKPTFEVLKASGFRVARMRTWFNDALYSRNLDRAGNERTVLWVGRFEIPKDPVLAVEVFGALESNPDTNNSVVRYVLIGEGTLRRSVEERIRTLGLEDRVEVTGALPRSEVAHRMREADVLLMTSHFEGSPRVMYEALGSGIPVVASREADPDCAIDPQVNGRVVTDRNPAEFAREINVAMAFSSRSVAESVKAQASSKALSHLWQVTSGQG